MPDFSSGVKAFVKAKCTIEVNFPIDYKGNADVCCKQCPYLSSNEKYCQLTKEVVHYPQKYIGYDCPLTFEE